MLLSMLDFFWLCSFSFFYLHTILPLCHQSTEISDYVGRMMCYTITAEVSHFLFSHSQEGNICLPAKPNYPTHTISNLIFVSWQPVNHPTAKEQKHKSRRVTSLINLATKVGIILFFIYLFFAGMWLSHMWVVEILACPAKFVPQLFLYWSAQKLHLPVWLEFTV